MKLDDLLAPKQEKFDIFLASPYDLGNDDDTARYADPGAREARRGLFVELLRPRKPRTKFMLNRIYARLERPYEVEDVDDESAGDDTVRSIFEQQLAAPLGGDTVSPADATPLDKLFSRRPERAIPITRDTYGPLQRDVTTSFDRLSRFGWNSPVADPYGNVMRTELRKLVRTS